MNVKNRGKGVFGWALIGGLAGAIAIVVGGLWGIGEYSTSVAHASTEWVGDESGALIGVDADGKLTQSFPLKLLSHLNPGKRPTDLNRDIGMFERKGLRQFSIGVYPD